MGLLLEMLEKHDNTERNEYLLNRIDAVEVLIELMGYTVAADHRSVYFLNNGKCPFTLVINSYCCQVKVRTREYRDKMLGLEEHKQFNYITLENALGVIETLL